MDERFSATLLGKTVGDRVAVRLEERLNPS